MTAGTAAQEAPLDVLVVGSGVAGLSAAVRLAGGGEGSTGARIGVLTKGELSDSTTRWAQGGVAAALSGDEDSTDLHLADTLAAGAGLCDVDAVRVLVDEGPARVQELVALGAQFDREASGGLSLTREGGHSQPRVVHAGGAATGAEVERALVEATRRCVAALMEGWFALDLLVEGGRCRGLRARRPDGAVTEIAARHVVLATGGAGQLFSVTTNPAEATGDGVAMALRAGIPVADVEFVQFHPTALHHPAMPRPLLSEALRGHGAVLRDARGERFVDELAARDVVSRAMALRMAEQGVDHLWLDATGLDDFADRFPTILASLEGIGLDPSREWLPIAPAAHHLSGGVLTDLVGASTLPGLWAVGETACTGVHGANRLASNSLLEGMVFGGRLAEAIAHGREGPTSTGVLRPWFDEATAAGEHPAIPLRPLRPVHPPAWASHPEGETPEGGAHAPDVAKRRDLLQRSMTGGAGLVRESRSLAATRTELAELARWSAPDAAPGAAPAEDELRNLLAVALAVVDAAETRHESRGAHNRPDFPATDPAWRCRLVIGA